MLVTRGVFVPLPALFALMIHKNPKGLDGSIILFGLTMPLYRVIIHGRNFRLKIEDKWEKFGFYAPRWAEAPDPILAEQVALEDFRQSPKYLDLLDRSLNSETDPPVLSGEDIEEVAKVTGNPAGGLALYREADE